MSDPIKKLEDNKTALEQKIDKLDPNDKGYDKKLNIYGEQLKSTSAALDRALEKQAISK